METVKELKNLILEHLVNNGTSEDEAKQLINDAYEKKAKENPIFESNKQIAYNIIAREIGVKLVSAVSSKSAFPLKINELRTSEKTNFDVSGYVISPPKIINTSNPDIQMALFEIADDTGSTGMSASSISVGTLDKLLDAELNVGDFVVIHNLTWKDKTVYSPNFTQFSSLEKAEPSFEFSKVKATPIPALLEGKYGTVKGIITYIPEGAKMTPYHCPTGHWFTGKTDKDIGDMAMCTKCQKPMEVEKSTTGQGIQFADQEGILTVDISTFARVKDFNVMDEFIFNGKYEAGMMSVTTAIPIKKN